MDILTLVASTRAVVDLVKDLKAVSDKIQQQEIQSKILGLMDEALNAKHQAIELKAILSDKEAEIFELKKRLELKDSLEFRSGLWWAAGDAIPFCPKCHEADGKNIHMRSVERTSTRYFSDSPSLQTPAHWICPVCSLKTNK